MADSVFKLVVDSKEYDSKIQRATSGLMAFEKKCREVGGTLEFVEKEDLDFVKALGKMETVSSSATGKLGELKRAFTELSVQYKHLTDAEKNSPYGKALSESLREIKTRIADSKEEIASVGQQLGEGGLGGALDQLAGKFGLNIKQLAGWGLAIGAAKGALDLAKDAFFNAETNLDEWGRAVQASESLYKSFLSALNNGDIGGFLSRIDEIVSAAREAYDALDTLGTFTAFNQRNVARSRASYAKALDAYRLNPTAENKETLAAANQQVMADLEASHKMTEDAYQKALQELAKDRLSSKELQEAFVKTFSEGTWTDLVTAKASYSKGTGLNFGQQYFNGMRTYGGRVDMSGSGKWRDMTDLEKQQFEFARALYEVNDSQIKEVQALGAQSIQITEQIYQQDRAYNRLAGNNAPLSRATTSTTTPTKATGSGYQVGNYLEMPAEGTLADLQRQASVVQASMGGATTNEEYAEMEAHLQTIIDKMNEIKGVKEVTFTPGSLNDLNNQLKEAQAELANMSPEAEGWADALENVREKMAAVAALQGKINISGSTGVQTAKDTTKAWQVAASAVSTVGSALQQIEDPAAKIAGIIAQAIAQIALTFATSLKGTIGPWDWIAAATAGTATMISTIAAIKSVTSAGKFAEGGIVPGNNYNDGLVANVSSGELILNRAQQDSIAGQLSAGNPFANLQLTTKVQGTDLLVILNNANRSMGGSRSFYTERH